ncbi:MAG: hypothetical protein HY784_11700, partial [Chloroflexi bacterium]|nr:hypothetical protein [Chloroflexota bacterium]
MTHPAVKMSNRIGAVSVVLFLSLTLTACGVGVSTGGAIKVVSDLPLTGSAKSESLTLENAIRQAFEEKNYKACNGRWTIQYEPHDDASA